MSGQTSYITMALNTALTAILLATDTTLASRVSWVNEGFDANEEGDANAGTAWVRPTVLIAEPYQLTVGANGGYYHHLGLYQIDLFVPKGDGDGELATADTIASYFRGGNSVQTESVWVRFNRSWVRQGISEDVWFHIPIMARWWADIANT